MAQLSQTYQRGDSGLEGAFGPSWLIAKSPQKLTNGHLSLNTILIKITIETILLHTT